jgi:hypothetical protein
LSSKKKKINLKIVAGALPQKLYSNRTLMFIEVTHREGIKGQLRLFKDEIYFIGLPPIQ